MLTGSTRPRVLALTGGHSYDRDAFADLLTALPFDITWVEHPDAGEWLDPDRLSGFVGSLHYDMPGARPPEQPSPAVAAGITALADRGHGFVVLHHALASWPIWPYWSELVGGQYFYAPNVLRGSEWPDSGFRHAVRQHLAPAATDHPVVAGLEDGLDLVDETYLCPVFADEVTPLLRTDAQLVEELHVSTVHAVRLGAEDAPRDPDWHHPAGGDLAAWCKVNGDSRLVYIQPGDTARTLRDAGYQRLVANALGWAGRVTGA